MGLKFQNSTNSIVFVAYAYFNQSCAPGFVLVPFPNTIRGWFRILPGQTVEVFSSSANRNLEFYAESQSRNLVWSGSELVKVPTQAFHRCKSTACGNCRTVGMRTIRSTSFDFTINLVTSISKVNSSLRNVRNAVPSKVRTQKSNNVGKRKIIG